MLTVPAQNALDVICERLSGGWQSNIVQQVM